MYEPIVPPPPAEQYAQELARFDRVRDRWTLLRDALGVRWTALASREEERRASVATGAIDGVYDLDDDATQGLIREGLDSEAGRNLDLGTFDIIAAQAHAMTLVVASVAEDQPVTIPLIRQLHHTVTAGQATHVARDEFGRQFRRELVHGEWKDRDDSVKLPDGTVRDFVPAAQVEAEIERMVAIMADLQDAPYAYRGAVAHHLLTHIHPFAEGNGRTARLLATHQLLRGGLPGLVVELASKPAYLQSLDAADHGDLGPFLSVLAAALRASLQRVEDRAFAPGTRDMFGATDVARALNTLRRPDRGAQAIEDDFASFGSRIRELFMQRMADAAAELEPDATAPVIHDAPRSVEQKAHEYGDQLRAWDGFTVLASVHGRTLRTLVAFYVLTTPGVSSIAHGEVVNSPRTLDVDIHDPDWRDVERWVDATVSDTVVQAFR